MQRARLRELQAVTDPAPDGEWCWAGQAVDALRDMKHLADASLAIDGTLGHLDRAKPATTRHRYHSALLIGKCWPRTRSSQGIDTRRPACGS